jgi:Domain of unknown function (DUF5753)
LGVLDALSDEVETLVSLASEDRQPGWWRQYAEVLHSPHTQLPDEAARAAELRRARQVRLLGPDPIHLDVVINEGALRRAVGGPTGMCGQLTRLVEIT